MSAERSLAPDLATGTRTDELLSAGTRWLEGSSDSPRLDAELLLAHALDDFPQARHVALEHCILERHPQHLIDLIRRGSPFSFEPVAIKPEEKQPEQQRGAAGHQKDLAQHAALE